MEAFRFLEFHSYQNIIEAYKGWWKIISSQCFVASWTEVLKIALSSSIQVAMQLELTRVSSKKDLSSLHTMEMSRRRPSFITDVLLVKQRKPRTTGTPPEIPSPLTNVGDSHIEVLLSDSIQSGRDITYYIKYMENLIKSQPTVPKPQEILQELLDTINIVIEQLTELQSLFRENQLENIFEQGHQIAELNWSSSRVRELTDVCARVAQETQLCKIKFNELSIRKSRLIDDKEAAQEMYEDSVAGWAKLVNKHVIS
ncbi:hypothetical protein M9H77_18783 [Catharanthus roseus]|uniref:Uncharacterized protein n=1 Tax=Catharanthus roseus TaxID=4058 RepID=A0ACC0B8E7_CATRO|nr:hypothetical protein M9H77_18783 [Catharanthus roseus]